MDIRTRGEVAVEITQAAGALALEYFRRLDTIVIDSKGHQDFVSQADREVEIAIRQRLAQAFPDDTVVGEEQSDSLGNSGFTWVIDPIDGTANFISAIPAWVVVLAGVSDRKIQVAVIHDPCHGETYVAIRGQGATLNGVPLRLPADGAIAKGSVGIGYSGRVEQENSLRLMRGVLDHGGVFVRNGTGALSLAYVAAGRLLGYAEEHMNAWDCLAGQLLVAEAGGRIEDQDADAMIASGGRVVAGAPGVFEELVAISDQAFQA